jgi:hypothetical protein
MYLLSVYRKPCSPLKSGREYPPTISPFGSDATDSAGRKIGSYRGQLSYRVDVKISRVPVMRASDCFILCAGSIELFSTTPS